MPRFNGPIFFLFEVLAHLLWCYLVFGVFYFLFFGAAASLVSGGIVGFVLLAVGGASNPSVAAFVLQLVTMSSFRICFWPRFPYAPQILTFVLAMLFGAAIGAVAWGFEQFLRSGQDASPAAVAAWLNAHMNELAGWFLTSMVVSAVVGSLGQVLFISGLKTDHFSGLWRWLGGLFVGANAYEDFVEREKDRLYGRPF